MLPPSSTCFFLSSPLSPPLASLLSVFSLSLSLAPQRGNYFRKDLHGNLSERKRSQNQIGPFFMSGLIVCCSCQIWSEGLALIFAQMDCLLGAPSARLRRLKCLVTLVPASYLMWGALPSDTPCFASERLVRKHQLVGLMLSWPESPPRLNVGTKTVGKRSVLVRWPFFFWGQFP